jgi:hypothetical protein
MLFERILKQFFGSFVAVLCGWGAGILFALLLAAVGLVLHPGQVPVAALIAAPWIVALGSVFLHSPRLASVAGSTLFLRSAFLASLALARLHSFRCISWRVHRRDFLVATRRESPGEHFVVV